MPINNPAHFVLFQSTFAKRRRGPRAPTNTVLPAISGDAVVGETLTTSDGTWNDHGSAITGYEYQWLLDGEPISGATNDSYEIVEGDAGSDITVEVTATNAGGATAATSEAVGPVLVPPTGVLLSTYDVDDDTNTAFATLFMVGGTEPATFAIQGAAGAYSISGDQLSADGSQTEGTDNITIRVTDANGLTYDQAVALTVSATITPPFQPPAEDPPVIPDPEDPEFDGGGYTQTPVSSTTSEGFKVTGKNGGAAHLLLDWGVPLANAVYTMRYSADWSGMTRLGREAAVGFGFKQNNSFHMAGIRGNGSNPTTMLKSKVHGDFRKANQFTITNDGSATHGTKDGPNWVQIAISSNGAAYTLRTSSDGVSWSDQYTGAVPTPLSNATDALQFGPAAYFTNQDKGAFQITFEEYEASDVTAPTLTNAVDTATGQTTASLSVDTDEGNGTLYWVVTTSATKPSKAQVKAGQNHLGASAAASGSQAVSSTGTKNANATGLTASTAYFAHFMHEDAAGNQSDVVSGDGFTTSAAYISATGGTVTTDGDYKVHTFTSSGDFVISSGTGDVEYLIVAGGGGGGSRSAGGGGGAGGLLAGTSSGLNAGTFPVVVGGGGNGASSSGAAAGSDGSNSSFNALVAVGGGGGGAASLVAASATGRNGGSGGGAGRDDANVSGGTGTAGQGYNGGASGPDPRYSGGGGGGGGGVGGDREAVLDGLPGSGGAGVASSITGSSLTYAIGGQGGRVNGDGGRGGQGGGGTAPSGRDGTAGQANRGGGGGGGGGVVSTSSWGAGGNGGSGVVILRYRFQ